MSEIERDDESVGEPVADTSLRAAFQSHLRAQQTAARDACPSPEALEALARGAADGNPNVPQLEHVLRCAMCHPEFSLLRSIADAEAAERVAAERVAAPVTPRPAPAVAAGSSDSTAHASRVWSARNLAAAAIVLVAVGLGSQRLRQSRDARIDNALTRDSMVRDASGQAGAVELSLIAPLQEITEPLPVFVWHAIPGTARYILEAVDTSGVTIISRETTDTSVTLTADEALRLRRQPAADWMVTARRVDGNERRSSVVRVQVRSIEAH